MMLRAKISRLSATSKATDHCGYRIPDFGLQMLKIDTRSSIPLVEQIKNALRDLVARGLLKPGDDLQPVSSLAQSLLVSPNIVARAYRELIKDGFLVAESGKPPVIATGSVHQAGIDRAELIQEFVLAAQQLLDSGLPWEDLDSAIQILRNKGIGGAVRASAGSMCPYCRESIAEDAATISCMICKTIHHGECWDETGRCSVFGCKGKVKLLL